MPINRKGGYIEKTLDKLQQNIYIARLAVIHFSRTGTIPYDPGREPHVWSHW